MLEIQVQPHAAGNCLLITLKGDANLREIDRLALELRRAGSSHPRRAIIEVSGVTFMASLALGTLVEFSGGVKTREGRVALAGAAGVLLDAVKRSRLDTLFVMADSVDDASAKLVALVPAKDVQRA